MLPFLLLVVHNALGVLALGKRARNAATIVSLSLRRAFRICMILHTFKRTGFIRCLDFRKKCQNSGFLQALRVNTPSVLFEYLSFINHR
jgi:hypothetical protein